MCNKTNRKAYRCWFCLAVFATDDDLHAGKCSICGNGLEFLGKVNDHGVTTQMQCRCKCDANCVHARGPKCDCQCGGVNHMSGVAGYTLVSRELGKITVDISDPKIRAKHVAIAKRTRDFEEKAEKAMRTCATIQNIKQGNWVDNKALWLECTSALKKYTHAFNLLVPSTRFTKLENAVSVIEKLAAIDPVRA